MIKLGQPGRMSSRERVLTTFAHQEADRVPIDYCANPGIDARLRAYFKANDREELARALGVDTWGIAPPYTGPRLHREIPGRRVDPLYGVRTRWVEHGSGGYWDFCDFPLKNASLEDVQSWPMPSPDDFDYSVLPDMCRQHDDYCLYVGGAGLGDVINSSGMVFGQESVLIALMMDDPVWECYIDRKHAVEREIVARTLEAAKGRIDFMWMGEDLGTQDGPMISMERFRKHIRPRHQKFINIAKAYNLPVMVHTCGSSSWAYEDFIEMGVDGVDTLQPEAKDMAPAFLKKRFGGRLFFHGCISTAGPVSFGTVDEVIADCRQVLEIMMPGGGYCFAPTHALQDNSPTENVVAMYEAAHKYGRYR